MILFGSSCNKFGDTNMDPTKSDNLDASKQLSYLQVRYSGDLSINEVVGGVLTMPLVQQIGGIWLNRNGQMYVKSLPYLSALWEYGYTNDIVNVVDAVHRTKDVEGKTNLNAVLRIMKVYEYARMTDLYGDIPYVNGARGYIDDIDKPDYTPQKEIYDDFFKELSEASAQLDAAKDKLNGDLFYGGNIAAWKKFANSLRLRLGMRLVKIDPARARLEVEAAYNAGVFTSNDDICLLKHSNVQNDYVDFRGNGVSVAFNQAEVQPRICNTFLDALNNTNDPRLKVFVRYYKDIPFRPFERLDITSQVVAKIGYKGVDKNDYVWDNWQSELEIDLPDGAKVNVTNNEQKAQFSNEFIRNDAPFLHLTYAEVELLLADACFRWGINLGGDYNSHYRNGVEAAMKQLTLFTGKQISDDAISMFLQGNVLRPGAELEQINTQLWIALFLNGPEAFANWRRSGYPVLTPAKGYDTEESTIPRRLQYPLSEQEQNADNYRKAVQALGGTDNWTLRVWWDK